MGRKPTDLEPWKETIRKMIKEDNLRRQDVLEWLQEKGVDIHERTLNNRLRDWGIHKHVKSDDTPELRARIKQLFFSTQNTEEVILGILHAEGWTIEQRRLSRIRHDLGLFRALTREDRANIEEEDKKVMATIQTEIDKGEITSYTRDGLYEYFRAHEIIVSRDRLYELFKRQAPHLCNPANKPPVWRGPRPPRRDKTAEELAKPMAKPRPKKQRPWMRHNRAPAASPPASAPTNTSTRAQHSTATPQTEENWPINPVLPDADSDDTPQPVGKDTHSSNTRNDAAAVETATHGGTIWIRELGQSLQSAWANLMTQTATLPATEREAFRLQYIQNLTQATEPFLRPVGRGAYVSRELQDMGLRNGIAAQTTGQQSEACFGYE
ncbi:hypothetical protein K490DRAFT_53594 [Saccharata proteae CBS 121410]|uniref:Clr5 domain-containing protein n=1 Tax=Saccharata proteae CBS 121410 TaxID=1314787 RepID=A0A9P4M274_9PEZI|nr:hypothetical protein K490DRAFT_53594 [Saccharata proteae CBS 121410]